MKGGWHHVALVHNFGKDTIFVDGSTTKWLPDICFDEIRLSNIARKEYPVFTLEYWVRIGFSLKHWTYAQKWSFAQCLK